VFKLHTPLSEPLSPALIPRSVDRPARPESVSTTYQYTATQRVKRIQQGEKKRFTPECLLGDQWVPGAGAHPWPFYGSLGQPGEAVIEVEGEKCVDTLRSIGLCAITHPGHDQSPEALLGRYQSIAGHVGGVIYVADHDATGAAKAEKVKKAALLGGVLNVQILHAADLWPDVPAGGSVDDVPTDQIELAIRTAASSPRPLPVKVGEGTPDAARIELRRLIFEDGLSGSALRAEQLRIAAEHNLSGFGVSEIVKELIEEERNAYTARQNVSEILALSDALEFRKKHLTLEYILPKPYIEPIAFISESLQADDLVSAMVFLTAAATAIKTGTLIRGDYRSYVVPPNIFLALVGKSGLGKTPILNALCEGPLKLVKEHYAYLSNEEYRKWEINNMMKKKSEREDKPRPFLTWIGDYSGESLSQQLSIQEKKNLGLLLKADELSSVFTSLNSYKGSGKGSEEQQLLSLFDGKGDTSLRVKGLREYAYAQFSVVGGIQPLVFDRIAANGDPSGLFARIMLMPLVHDFRRRNPIEPPDTIIRHNEYEKVLQNYILRVHSMPIGHYKLCDDGMQILATVKHKATLLSAETESDEVSAIYGKTAGYTLKIAGLLHILSVACGEIEPTADISAELVEKASVIVTHMQTYAVIAHNRIKDNKVSMGPKMADSIIKAGKREGGVTPARFRSDYMPRDGRTPSTDTIHSFMDEMVKAGLGRWEETSRGARRFHSKASAMPQAG
jgi:hypothetical protein